MGDKLRARWAVYRGDLRACGAQGLVLAEAPMCSAVDARRAEVAAAHTNAAARAAAAAVARADAAATRRGEVMAADVALGEAAAVAAGLRQEVDEELARAAELRGEARAALAPVWDLARAAAEARAAASAAFGDGRVPLEESGVEGALRALEAALEGPDRRASSEQ